jgi:hypothetical protein
MNPRPTIRQIARQAHREFHAPLRKPAFWLAALALAILALCLSGCSGLKKYFERTERTYGVYYFAEGGSKFGAEVRFTPTGKRVVPSMK